MYLRHLDTEVYLCIALCALCPIGHAKTINMPSLLLYLQWGTSHSGQWAVPTYLEPKTAGILIATADSDGLRRD